MNLHIDAAHTIGVGRTSLEVADMDIEIVSQMVSNLGFPIACVIVMFFMWNKEREDHKTEADKWIEAINNNTLVMEKLLERLGK